jgi:hypothetical protein
LERTGQVSMEALQLDRASGAYWMGDESKPMLQRVHATAWETPEQLATHRLLQAEVSEIINLSSSVLSFRKIYRLIALKRLLAATTGLSARLWTCSPSSRPKRGEDSCSGTPAEPAFAVLLRTFGRRNMLR